jgi:protein involved in polysaccharide export with SLBB domain
MAFICLLAALLAANCGGSGQKPQTGFASDDGRTGADQEDIWLPEAEPYRMTVGDVLSVKFFYYPDYDVVATVRPDGMVTIPHVGELKAAGVRPVELEEEIRNRYAEVLAEPEVSVMVAEFGNQRIFVFGEVQSPGAYPLAGMMTVVDAVVVAGGTKEAAGFNNVILMRKSADGRYVARKLDLGAKLSGRDTEMVALAPADIVFVPLSGIGKLDRFVDQFFHKLTPAWRFYILGRNVADPDQETIISQ